jgi:putative DNA primase/helicase
LLSAREVQRALGGEVLKGNRVLCPGPNHSDEDRSLVVTVAPDDEDGFTVHSFSAIDDWRDCRDYVREKLGLPTWNEKLADKRRGKFTSSDAERITREAARAIQSAKREAEHEADRRQHIAWARDIWRASRPARGTLVERYLTEVRRLELPEDTDGAIRFHPRLKLRDGTFTPAMVCAMTSIDTGEFVGVHRTFLAPDGSKLEKKTLGTKVGSVIRIDPDEAVTDGLAIAEGVESTIAARYLYRPAWCVIDAGNMQDFPLVVGVQHLEIFADNDASGTGLKAASACLERWQAAGREARIIMPKDAGADVADLVAEYKVY